MTCGGEADSVCAACGRASYCSELCQELDLQEHLTECSANVEIARRPGRGSHLSRTKAWELIHNPPHGRPLTPQQRRYFWAVYHNKSYNEVALNLNEPVKEHSRLKMPLNWSPVLGVSSSEYKQYVVNGVIRDELTDQLVGGQFFISIGMEANTLAMNARSRGKITRTILRAEARGPNPLLNSWNVDGLGVVPGSLRDAVNWIAMRLELGRLVEMPIEPNQRWNNERFERLFPRRKQMKACIRPDPIGFVDVEKLNDLSYEFEPVVLEVADLQHCLKAPVWSRLKSGHFEGEMTCSPAQVLEQPSEFAAYWERILSTNLCDPIIITQTETGTEVLDGMYRLALAQLCGVPTILARIVGEKTLSAAKSE